jgi:hypothetical protein
VKACITDIMPAIELFSSHYPNELLRIHPYERFEEKKIAKNIYEATGMTVEELYDQVLNSTNDVCLQTLSELWSQEIEP